MIVSWANSEVECMRGKRSIVGDELKLKRKSTDIRLRVCFSIAITLAHIHTNYFLIIVHAGVFTRNRSR